MKSKRWSLPIACLSAVPSAETREPVLNAARRPGLVLMSLGAVLLACSGTAWARGGTANPTTASFNPTAVSLKTIVGTPSSATVFLFDNTSAALTIGSITVSGAQAGDYSLSGTCTPGAVVIRDHPCQLQVTLTPGDVGTRTAAVNATFANAPAITLPLNGQGISATPTPPAINVTGIPASGVIGFGSRALGFAPGSGTFADATLQISDTGGSTLMQSESVIGANSADFQLIGKPTASGSTCAPLLTNQNVPCVLPITFVPTAVGTRNATLRITSNDPLRPTIDIPLTGVGTAAAVVPPPPVASFTDVTGLWGAAGNTGWALSIKHDKVSAAGLPGTDTVVGFWITHDTNGQSVWLEIKGGHWADQFTYTGEVHRSNGSPFTGLYAESQLVDSIVGTATLVFTDANTGTLNFNINGFTGSQAITRGALAF